MFVIPLSSKSITYQRFGFCFLQYFHHSSHYFRIKFTPKCSESQDFCGL